MKTYNIRIKSEMCKRSIENVNLNKNLNDKKYLGRDDINYIDLTDSTIPQRNIIPINGLAKYIYVFRFYYRDVYIKQMINFSQQMGDYWPYKSPIRSQKLGVIAIILCALIGVGEVVFLTLETYIANLNMLSCFTCCWYEMCTNRRRGCEMLTPRIIIKL